jgi:hypothetical protein
MSQSIGAMEHNVAATWAVVAVTSAVVAVMELIAAGSCAVVADYGHIAGEWWRPLRRW